MTPNSARDFLVLATGFGGLLAGASADRYLVQVPAWRHLDVMIWAEHSRHADLGNGRFCRAESHPSSHAKGRRDNRARVSIVPPLGPCSRGISNVGFSDPAVGARHGFKA
jgi:hypothetical protein